MSSSRWRAALALVIALAAFGSVAGTAGAAYRHPGKTSQFGRPGTEVTEYEQAFGGLNSLAVDQTRNRLYVGTETAVYGYSIGNVTEHSPLGGAFPIKIGEEYGGGPVAADSSSGNVYVVKGVYPSRLLGFDSSGSPLAGFPVKFSFPQCGLAVNNEGLVAESDPENGKVVRLFNSSGILVRTIDVSVVGRPCQIAFDETTNNLYVATGEGGVFRFAAADGYSAPVNIAPVGARGLAFDASRGVLYVLYSEHAVAYGRNGEELETFASPSEGGYELNGIAVDESTGAVYIGGGGYPTQIGVYPGVVVPDVTTGEPVGNEVVSGHVDPAGGGNITECEVEYGETTSYGETAPCSPATPYTTARDVTATLTGLTVEDSYHYRVVAGNANGKNYGADEVITPHHVDALRTNPADELTRTCATLNASFTGNGEETHYHFEYGEEAAYGSESPTGVTSGTGAEAESYRLCQLTPGTTYHYRVVAENSKGKSVANDRTFTTVDAVEQITTEPGTVLNAEEAELHASFTGNGEDTHYYFEYGYNILYGSTTAAPPGEDVGSPTGKTALSSTLQGLYPGTTYHYRIVASNGAGTSYGEDVSFTTPRLPVVTLSPPSNEHELPGGSRSVTFNGTVNPLNGGPTTYHFEYGPTTNYVNSTPESGPVGADPNAHPVSAVVDGLDSGTTYHYRLVAHNAAGTSYSADQTYQAIPGLPTVVSSGAAGIGASSATINAVVRPGNGATVVLIDYGTSSEYGQTVQTGAPPATGTEAQPPLPADEADHAVSRTITGLQPNTTYHFRVAATNFAGTSYGPDQTFSTAGVPIILGERATEVGQNAATFVATVSPNLVATSYRFEYGPEGRYGSSTMVAPLGADGVGHQVSARVTGLTPGTKYQVRVVASNAIGTTAGGGARFTTAAAPATHKPLVCKKGTVKRKGKCVKKPKKKKHKKKKQHKPKKKAAKHGRKGKR